MPRVTPVAELPVTAVTPERFQEVCSRRREPLVFRGLVKDWAALKWDPSRLEARWPRGPVRATWTSADGSITRPIELSRDTVFRGIDPDDPGGPGSNWYFDVPRDLSELACDFPPRAVLRGQVDFFWLFLGRNTTTVTHFHSRESGALFQVLGKKRVLLHPPGDTARLYPYPVYSRRYTCSRVDLRAPDFAKYPRARDARGLEVTLEPGDVLFVSVHWWHGAHGIGLTASVGLFWNARLRDFRFPSPGFRTLVGWSLGFGKGWLHRRGHWPGA